MERWHFTRIAVNSLKLVVFVQKVALYICYTKPPTKLFKVEKNYKIIRIYIVLFENTKDRTVDGKCPRFFLLTDQGLRPTVPEKDRLPTSGNQSDYFTANMRKNRVIFMPTT